MSSIVNHIKHIVICILSISFLVGNDLMADNRKVNRVYKLSSTYLKKLNPEVFPLNIDKNDLPLTAIFSVPAENAVGTNGIGNEISLIKFDDGKLIIGALKKDFMPYISAGDLRFLSTHSDDTIGYSQTRGFLLFNIKDKTHQDNFICESLRESINNVGVIDWENRLFLFEIARFDKNVRTAIPVPEKHLRLINLDSDKALDIRNSKERVLASFKLDKNEKWVLWQQVIFSYKDNIINSYDVYFQQISHPLVDVFEKHKKYFRKIDQLYIHPSLPFAVLVEIDRDSRDNYKTWVLNWVLKEQERQMIHILSGDRIEDVQFSPDGNWVIMTEKGFSEKYYYLFPIKTEIDHYLGTPIHLGKMLGYRNAWIKQPQSFVVTEGQMLYKWEITEDSIIKNVY